MEAIFTLYFQAGAPGLPRNVVVIGARMAVTTFFVSNLPNISNIWALRESTGLIHGRTSAPFQLTNGPMSLYVFCTQSRWEENFRGWLSAPN